jgi:hypothetical protein
MQLVRLCINLWLNVHKVCINGTKAVKKNSNFGNGSRIYEVL